MDRLLPLREELELFEREPGAKGETSWTIFDPVRNIYFRISEESLFLMRHWQVGSAEELLEQVRQQGHPVEMERVQELHAFLLENQLLTVDSEQQTARLIQQQKNSKQTLKQKILLGYLFFRIPLVKPDRFLETVLTAGRSFISKKWLLVILSMGMTGIFLTIRQWDAFLNTAVDSFSSTGLLYFLMALVFVKSVHELGHGLAAKYFGCRIPTMGIAFLVMFPVLYTDTTDTWRLASYRQRMIVGAAGLFAELIIACLALLLWPFLEDGPLKNIVFMLAAVTWVTSLLINLNPFMRFDGYYLLSDWWRIENLQSRAFTLARWQTREWLFGLNAAMPESWSGWQKKKLLFYAYGTWIYRFLLFLAIALIVYHFFFKALGLVLFLVEIFWFIVRPVYQEMRLWWQMRDKFQWNRRNMVNLIVGGILFTIPFIPFDNTLQLPAVMTARQSVKVFPPESSGKMDKLLVKTGETVKIGQPLFVLSNPDLNQKKAQVEIELNLIQTLLNRRAANHDYLQESPVIFRKKAALLEELSGIKQQLEALIVRAPVSGNVVYLDEWVRPGQWLHEKSPILQIASIDTVMVEAYVTSSDLNRLALDDSGEFYPDDITRSSVDLMVSQISPVSSRTLESEYLSSDYGGNLEVIRNRQGQAVPVEGVYRVMLSPIAAYANLPQALTGTIRIKVTGQSSFTWFWNAFWSVVIRESGF